MRVQTIGALMGILIAGTVSASAGWELGRWSVGNPKGEQKGIHFNSLMTYSFDRMDPVAAALDACIKVRVRKAA